MHYAYIVEIRRKSSIEDRGHISNQDPNPDFDLQSQIFTTIDIKLLIDAWT